MAEPTLFDPGAPAEPGPRLSADARRTIRQQQAMASGLHPLSLLRGVTLRLHPGAPPVDDRKAPGPRCGTCALAIGNGFGYVKCTAGRTGEIGTKSFRHGPYETRGDATTLRAWWPGCERWEAASG